MGNRLTLISQISNAPLIDGRFAEAMVVNCDPVTGKQKTGGGMLSVVFRAVDRSNGKSVAIKFFDPEYNAPDAGRRQDMFFRECELLSLVSEDDRCLQLVQPVNRFDITITDPVTGHSLTKDTYYFIVEWLEDDINDFFWRQQNFSAYDKLQVFRDIVVGVFALHRRGIYHRDLKPDNLRIVNRAGQLRVLPIDLGSAAAYHSAHLGTLNDYAHPPGAGGYAPIEAHCRLSLIRSLAPFSDVYALGCMLHDLFNLEDFRLRLGNDAGFLACLGACYWKMDQVLQRKPSDEEVLREWDAVLSISKSQITVPTIDGPGHSVPASISSNLNCLLSMLVDPDYKRRPTDIEPILRRVDVARRILLNSAAEERARIRRREQRRARLEKLNRRKLGTAKLSANQTVKD